MSRVKAEMRLTGQSIFVKDFADLGYLPEAVINWIALMGWSFDDHTEFFTMDDLIEKFDIERLNPSPAAIDFKKLDHFNGTTYPRPGRKGACQAADTVFR